VGVCRRASGQLEVEVIGILRAGAGPDLPALCRSQGLGRYFLLWAINKAWSYQPKRFWLHTCTKDHPAALPNYLKAGFAIYKEEVKDQG
jgi:GNAT superfamily N-acetyltransferase